MIDTPHPGDVIAAFVSKVDGVWYVNGVTTLPGQDVGHRYTDEDAVRVAARWLGLDSKLTKWEKVNDYHYRVAKAYAPRPR